MSSEKSKKFKPASKAVAIVAKNKHGDKYGKSKEKEAEGPMESKQEAMSEEDPLNEDDVEEEVGTESDADQ